MTQAYSEKRNPSASIRSTRISIYKSLLRSCNCFREVFPWPCLPYMGKQMWESGCIGNRKCSGEMVKRVGNEIPKVLESREYKKICIL